MTALSPTEITAFLLAIGILLFSARVLGELARRLHQPSVLGEILAGILLGPTVLGSLAPGVTAFLFPQHGGGAMALDGLTTLAIVLFLLVAGIEVDLSTVWRQGKTALCVALPGMFLPFVLGLGAGWLHPEALGYRPGIDRTAFVLFMATVLSISALPIIAKILLDLKIYRSDLGITLIAAAVVNDLLGWMIFAVVLGTTGAGHGGMPVAHTLWIAALFTVAMLSIVPLAIHRILPWVQAYASWPAGVLGFAFSFSLLAAAFTEWLGIHAIFGSFLAGVALGHSTHLREQTRTTLDEFISFFFAPLFFAGIGIRTDFATHFNFSLTAILLGLALTGKILGSALGGRWGGLPWREAWGAGFGMSAQGTMGIILGVLALKIGWIEQDVFVALVLTGMVTSLLSGPMLQRLLRLKKPRHFEDFLEPQAYLHRLQARSRTEAIRELSRQVAGAVGLEGPKVEAAVLAREQVMPTGIGHGIAVPHARLTELKKPLVGIGLSPAGIDFDAPDGLPARLICLILTPAQDNGAQIEILADLAAIFRKKEVGEKLPLLAGLTEFLALVRSERGA